MREPLHSAFLLAALIVSLLQIGSTQVLSKQAADNQERHHDPSQDTSLEIGANVDMGVLLRSAPNYVNTSDGDLFGLARKMGISVLRVTAFETFAGGYRDQPYTADEWAAVGRRAKEAGIRLIPLFELSTPDTKAIFASADNEARETVYVSRVEKFAKTVLSDAGLADSGVIAAFDIANEFPLYPSTARAFRTIASDLHARYPGIKVTVGGWKVPKRVPYGQGPDNAFSYLGTKTSIPFQWNLANDGAHLPENEDFVSCHIYNAVSRSLRFSRTTTSSTFTLC